MRLFSLTPFSVCLSIATFAACTVPGCSQAFSFSAPNIQTTIVSNLDPAESHPHFLFPWTNSLLVRPTVAAAAPPPYDSRLKFRASIEVVAVHNEADSNEGFERPISPRAIEASAGTFGDPSRYMQIMAGVVSDNDQRNDFLVRGGNPAENGFVIDNIEIPSINQLALSDTSGGLVSMLDAEAIQQLNLHTDAYDSKFDQRLSSVIEISTRKTGSVERHSQSELGFAGFGGSSTHPLGRDGSLFFSGRQSVLQYVTDDIGMNGVPVYRNALIRAENRIDERNNWWGVSLTGIDSIVIKPSATDNAETNPFDISYSGWRNTTGFNWQHVFSDKSYGVASLAHAAQSQSIQENDQLQEDARIYDEHTSDQQSTFKYDWTLQANKMLTLTAGIRESVDQLDYSVAQPLGLQNPYSEDPAPGNATAMSHRFATVASAGYLQAVFLLPHQAKLVVGERGMQWALGGHGGMTGKALVSMPILGHLAHLGYSEYEQLPSTLYLLSFNNLETLKPIRSRQVTGGVLLADRRHARVMVEFYDKRYLDYPVATAYPQLSMANIADTFGQAFLMFPMSGVGRGLARGAELTAETHPLSRLDATLTMAYARSWYSGMDGVLRRGNYDIPLTANLTSVWRITRSLTLSGRYSVASGRPYTPDNMVLSVAQNRDVYDLSRVNGVRSNTYSRVDFRFEQTLKVGRGHMTWHAGLMNAMNCKNFYSQAWQPRSNPDGVAEQDQMPLFPDGGIKYSF